MKKLSLLICLIGFSMSTLNAQKKNGFGKIVFSPTGWKIDHCLIISPPCEWRGEIPKFEIVHGRKNPKCWIALDCPGCQKSLCVGKILIEDVQDFEIILQSYDRKTKTYKTVLSPKEIDKNKLFEIGQEADLQNLSFLIKAKIPLKQDRNIIAKYIK